MVMIIVLLVALLVAIYEGVSIADQNQALRVKLNRELRDRENAARAFVAVCLQDVADVFRAHAKETADQAHWAAFNEAADRIEAEFIPQVAQQSEGV